MTTGKDIVIVSISRLAEHFRPSGYYVPSGRGKKSDVLFVVVELVEFVLVVLPAVELVVELAVTLGDVGVVGGRYLRFAFYINYL